MIRKAKKTDIEIISKIYIDSRRKTYENILPDDYLNSLTYAQAEKKWEEYLDYLAILISNLRMAYDMDIILGGEMGGYLSDYMIPLGEKVMKYNGFDHDLRYLKNCSYKKEASAVGAAKHFLQDFIGKI